MDSRALLDYALFQLTPTRTRCDLVIFSGKKSEKIASGLLEPFISHLKSAKDQIYKGGYSITLQPKTSEAAPWFTKSTLERFVRFVSTPEVLERVVTIEREIDQIESSNEQANGTVEVQGIVSGTDGDPSLPKSKLESSGSGDAEPEEKPKIRLQRVLESRKAMLKKEQAMAYARALVGGFEMDYIYDLVSFSDAFGAMRLREACINFMELCKRKNEDKFWMDEVAEMQASYMGTPALTLGGENNGQRGSLDTNEDNGSPMEFNVQQTEGVAQLPTWPNHLPQYMQNTQGQMFQQIPHYPGYVFPGMYPGNVPWPAKFHDPSVYLDRETKDSQRYKTSTKKKEKIAMKNDESTETGPSDSSDEQEQVHKKKHKKHSSRRVVIRNINYITPGKNEESNSASDSDSYDDEDEYVKGHHKKTSHKHKVRNGSKKASNKLKNDIDSENGGVTNSEEEKKGGNWDIFQNILMRDSDSKSNDVGSKTVLVQEDHFIEKAYGEEKFSSLDKKLDKPKYMSDDFLLTERFTGNRTEENNVNFEGGENFHGIVNRSNNDEKLLVAPRVEGEYYLRSTHFGMESSITKIQKEEDWLIGNKQEISDGRGDDAMFCGDQDSANRKRDVILDDSFMVQSRLSDGPLESQPKTDIYMVSGIDRANSMPENWGGKVETSNFYEPEELYMMIGRDSAADQVVASWNPEIDYDNENLPAEKAVASNGDNDESNMKTSKVVGRKVDGKGMKPKAPSGSLGRSKYIPTRSKVPNGGSKMRSNIEKEEDKRKKLEELQIQRQKRIAERSASKGITRETPTRSSKTDKTKLQGPTDENKKSHKPVMRSSTIDRLATARTPIKKLSTDSKANSQNRKPTSKVNAETKTTSLKKTKGTREGQGNNVNSPDQKKGTNNSESNSFNIQEIGPVGTVPSISEESISAEKSVDKNDIQNFETVKVLHTITSVEKIEANMLSIKDASDDKNCIQNDVDDHVGLTPSITLNPTVGNNLESTKSNGDEKKKISFSPEISVVDISTPPPNNETNPELVPSRKKWNNGESSPKAPKGFRKLLLFGRKS